MFRKSLFSAALKHTSQQLIHTMQQLEARRDDFELVEGLAAAARDAGLVTEAMFAPPATPYLKVQPHEELAQRLGGIVSRHGLNLVPSNAGIWLLVGLHGEPRPAIEVKEQP
ncbi:hypothetical protein PWG14_20655 (plasmid) [Chromobacterium amazonense]|uniref:hypothetical protein n=1 Tax=Chromobacterium amazonense TaxID=1382803 RepID=UPI00237DD1F3|nr:hypothetical protein [Chromobacterium amazonense]MDE1714902.1 hypothetical protein [Chromobacterium amazonense]